MNIGFYGHANTLVFTLTTNGKFIRAGLLGGIRQIYQSAKESLEAKEPRLEESSADHNSSEYRRDYYGIYLHESAGKRGYYRISQELGHEDGESPDNILTILPEGPIDMLAVWDEGYGGLTLPKADNVFWASDKALPDREQFEKIADNCFLFLDGKVLRNAGAMISRQISWERTASELILEISSNPDLSYLLKTRYLFISFELDGGVFITPKGTSGQLEAALMLTHGDIEGALNNKYPERASNANGFLLMSSMFFGSVAGFAAAADIGMIPKWEIKGFFDGFLDTMVSLSSFTNAESNATKRDTMLGAVEQFSALFTNAESNATKCGTMLRAVLEAGELFASLISDSGQGIFDERDENLPESNILKVKGWAAFPIPCIKNGKTLCVPDDWTVINSVGNRQIYDVAFEYVQTGAAAIEGLPQFRLGALTTVDRWEIESYSNIRNLILDYASADSIRPLSIAVFGAPGSGKSFGVTQIAMNILPGKIEKLEFNVSQFVSPMDLGAAFQKVRDVILEGKLPLVFFDEFDSDKDGAALGWVKSFLMPMQDGRFKDESGEHPLGKCILVFAGGTAPDFESFIAPPNSHDIQLASLVKSQMDIPPENINQDLKEYNYEQQLWHQNFKNIKGPDFVSRLRGTINVVGPNPKNKDDQNHILRRALLLRSLCQRDSHLATKDGEWLTAKDGAAPISPNIIRAMLCVPEFKHGARSMEAILDMSRIKDGEWKPDSLPFHSQLALHVDADAFLRLVANQSSA